MGLSDIFVNKELLTATYGNRNHLAGYFEMSIPLALGFLLTGLKPGKTFFLIYLVGILFVTFILTLSRGGWIGMTFGLVFMGLALMSNQYFQHKYVLKICIGAILLMSIVFFLTQR